MAVTSYDALYVANNATACSTFIGAYKLQERTDVSLCEEKPVGGGGGGGGGGGASKSPVTWKVFPCFDVIRLYLRKQFFTHFHIAFIIETEFYHGFIY